MDAHVPPEKIHVAKVSFAYDNGPLLGVLDKRGNAIASGKLGGLNAINKNL